MLNRFVIHLQIDGDSAERWTYARLRETIWRLTAAFADRGLCKGDVICMYAPNSALYACVLLAAMKLGVIVTGVNPLYTSGKGSALIWWNNPSIVCPAPTWPYFVGSKYTRLIKSGFRGPPLVESRSKKGDGMYTKPGGHLDLCHIGHTNIQLKQNHNNNCWFSLPPIVKKMCTISLILDLHWHFTQRSYGGSFWTVTRSTCSVYRNSSQRSRGQETYIWNWRYIILLL